MSPTAPALDPARSQRLHLLPTARLRTLVERHQDNARIARLWVDLAGPNTERAARWTSTAAQHDQHAAELSRLVAQREGQHQ